MRIVGRWSVVLVPGLLVFALAAFLAQPPAWVAASSGSEAHGLTTAAAEEAETQEEAETEPQEPDEGWYSDEQARRGREAYDQHCARCHGDDLEGIGGNPALSGEQFLEHWDTVRDVRRLKAFPDTLIFRE
jgi:mono/diheme cytochrome c family protein